MDLLSSSSSVGILLVMHDTTGGLTNLLQLDGRSANTVYCGRHASIPSRLCATNLPKSAA
jgi:hypothetical protein